MWRLPSQSDDAGRLEVDCLASHAYLASEYENFYEQCGVSIGAVLNSA